VKKTENQALNKAQSALKAGDRKKARHWALKATREIPQNEQPWLIMAANLSILSAAYAVRPSVGVLVWLFMVL